MLLEGKEIQKTLGFSAPDKQVIWGTYIRSPKPGIYWHSRFTEVPESHDAGCSSLTVGHIVGSSDKPVAECSLNISGVRPTAQLRQITC
jgi:hypothetical protein